MSFTLASIRDWLEAEVIFGAEFLDRQVVMAHSADLMSDVLAFSHSGSILLTGLANPQVLRTAEVAGLVGIIFVRGKRPSEHMLELAREFNLPVLLSALSMFDAVGILFGHGLRGWSFVGPGE